MAQNIEKFYSVAAGNDFTRDFLFRVTGLNLPGLAGDISMSEDELVYVKAANLPGRNIANVAVPYMGLNFNIPGAVSYSGSEGYQLTFYLDANSTLRNKLEQASQALFDVATSTGGYGTPQYSHYIELTQLKKDMEAINIYTLRGASLRAINDLQYNIAGGTGQTVDMTATFAYQFYELEALGA
jgi:hypothetical protein